MFNMLNKKMILAVLIVFAVLLSVLYTNPEVSAFFSSIGSRLTGQPIEVNLVRNVQFTLESDKYNEMDITLKNADIKITSSLVNARLSSGDVTARGSFDVSDFTGIGTIIGKKLYLKGTGENITFSSATLNIKTDVDLNTTFTSVEISDMSVNSLSLKKINGFLTSKNIDVTLSDEDVNMLAIKGKFVFDNGLTIEGSANKISTSSKLLLES
jgi:hypothetical protein